MPLCRDHSILARPQNDRRSGLALGQADLDAQPDELLDVPDVAALLEIASHDPLHDLASAARWRPACAISKWDRRVLGRRSIRSKRNCKPTASPCRVSAARAVGESRGIAAFGREVSGEFHPLPGQIRVQFERPPGHPRLVLRPRGQCELKAPLAEIAPRANRVREDVNSLVALIGGRLYLAPYGLWCERVSSVDGQEPQNQVPADSPLGWGPRFRCCSAVLPITRIGSTTADSNQLTYSTVEQRLESDLEARADSVANATGALLAPAVASGNIAGDRLDRQTPARRSGTSSGST